MKERLESLNATICNPFNQESARIQAVAAYRKPLNSLAEDTSNMEEVVGVFKKHITGSLLMVAEDPSETPMLRKGILDLAISYPLRELARLDEASREGSKTQVPGISMEWPDYAKAVCGDLDFTALLDRVLTIAEDDREDKGVRRSAVSSFNKIRNTASIFGVDIKGDEFNSRLLHIGETASDQLLRKYALSMGW